MAVRHQYAEDMHGWSCSKDGGCRDARGLDQSGFGTPQACTFSPSHDDPKQARIIPQVRQGLAIGQRSSRPQHQQRQDDPLRRRPSRLSISYWLDWLSTHVFHCLLILALDGRTAHLAFVLVFMNQDRRVAVVTARTSGRRSMASGEWSPRRSGRRMGTGRAHKSAP